MVNINDEFLFSNFSSSKTRISDLLSNLVGGVRVVDLLYHRPSSILIRKKFPNLSDIKENDHVILSLSVHQYIKPLNSRKPFNIICHNQNGEEISLIFFKISKNYLNRYFQVKNKILVSGKVSFFNGALSITHPDKIIVKGDRGNISDIESIYPLTEGITQKVISSYINKILFQLNEISSWLDKRLVKKYNWPSWKNAITSLHRPKTPSEISENTIYKERLAYDELLAFHIANKIFKTKRSSGNKITGGNELINNIINSLPFKLTSCQKNAFKEIENDMESKNQMTRLLQGEVGSGKTIIAFLAALKAFSNKKQSVIIAPISLLAQQHFNNLCKIISRAKINIKISILTSKTKKKEKKIILDDLKHDKIDILIGTHAVLYDEIIFKNLAFVVIDEQHRFGVNQRMKLANKGKNPDILLMSATPIPRSFIMTLYKDIEISFIKNRPDNFVEIKTSVLPLSKIDEIYKSLAKMLIQDNKIYWVCPLIEESKEERFNNVLNRYNELKQFFKQKDISFIHGKMKEKEKIEIIDDFTKKKSAILVTTTVIEVGIDIENATIMVIENAENFGLSQLHQLRGRVGRGEKKSYAILLYGKKITSNGKKRLDIIRKNNNGYEISKQDLKLRGPGNILTNQQSGFVSYKIADLSYHYSLFELAERNAEFILNNKETLPSKYKENIRTLLRIFGYDKALYI